MTHEWSNESHRDQVTINAPAEKVFDVLANLENTAAIVAGMTNIQKKSNDVFQGNYSVQVLGLPTPLSFPIEYRIIESQKPTKVVMQADGEVKGTIQFNLQPAGNQTKVSATSNFQIDIGHALEDVTSKAGNVASNLTSGLTGNVARTVGNVVGSAATLAPSVEAADDGNMHTSLTNLKLICENPHA